MEGPPLLIGFSAFCLLFPIVFFRHARALWLVMDCVLDSSALEDRVRMTGASQDDEASRANESHSS